MVVIVTLITTVVKSDSKNYDNHTADILIIVICSRSSFSSNSNGREEVRSFY